MGWSVPGLHGLVLFLVLGWLTVYLAFQAQRPDVLLVGDVTIDLIQDGSRPAGGSITYAAAVLNAMGIRACVVTVAGPDADLTVFRSHELHVVPSAVTLTFEHSYTWWGHSRKLRVTADPNVTLSRHHVPKHCQRARLVVLGPLTLNDVDAASFLTYDSLWDRLIRGPWQHIVYMAQGTQRQLGSKGAVLPLSTPSQTLLAGLAPHVSLFLSDVETDTWSAADVAGVARQVARLVITQGEKGAQEWNSTGIHMVDAVHVDPVVDTNGAGDTFATMYGLALAWGHRNPASVASYAAALAVQQPQSCKPACVGNSWAHLAQPWPVAVKLWVDLSALGPHLFSVAAAALRPVTAALAAAAAAAQGLLHARLPWQAVMQPIYPMHAPGAPPPPLPPASTSQVPIHSHPSSQPDAGSRSSPAGGFSAMAAVVAAAAPRSPAQVCEYQETVCTAGSDSEGYCPSECQVPSSAADWLLAGMKSAWHRLLQGLRQSVPKGLQQSSTDTALGQLQDDAPSPRTVDSLQLAP